MRARFGPATAARFAAGIAARHGLSRNGAGGVSRVPLRAAVTGAPARPVRLDLRVARRLTLVLARFQTTAAVAAGRADGRAPGAAALRLAERIVLRTSRRDGDGPGAAAARARGSAARPTERAIDAPAGTARQAHPRRPPAVRRVVRRPAALEPSRTPPSRTAPPALPPAVLGAAELDRVTSHVVETLDRRVRAWRERTGRV